MAVRPLSRARGTRHHKRKTAPGFHLGQFCYRKTGSPRYRHSPDLDEDFEVERIAVPAQAVFDSVRAKLLFESDVFWARSSIGDDVLQLWLETYQTSRSFRKRGIVELELP